MSELFRSIIEPLQTSAAAKSVFGDPVTAQGKTVIPVARIAYGFGGGAGPSNKSSDEGDGHDLNNHGGGGGVVAMPLGVIEITDAQTRYIPLDENRKLVAAAVIGLSLGLLFARRGKH